MVSNLSFFNGCFDKGRLKSFISWSLLNCGEQFTIELVENLKNLGFEYATQAGVSLSLDDLKIPPTKSKLVSEAELQITSAHIQYQQGHLTAVEKFQQLIDTWHRTSETLKQNVIQYFRATDILNPVYMMAFSGARGNVSQVRQLVGMRGLMADPQGQIIDFPIRSNFREGLTLTEYVISCYGARKGLVDTALRTANSGYLTRRLVDVSQHVIVCQLDCGTQRGIFLSDMMEGQKVLLSLENRLIGRILAENIYFDFAQVPSQRSDDIDETILTGKPLISLSLNSNRKPNLNLISSNKKFLSTKNAGSPTNLIGSKDQEISATLAKKIAKLRKQVLVRSPLTCEAKSSICQLCYGWSLAHGNLVSLGEAVGILAAQSIGEPGTQLTMRTFHTGGVFSGDLMTEVRAPFDGIIEFTELLQGILIRTPHGKIAFLTKVQGEFYIKQLKKSQQLTSLGFETILKQNSQKEGILSRLEQKDKTGSKQKFKIPASTILFVRQGEFVLEKQLIAEFSSISAQSNQRIQAKHNLNSEMEGQVFFENVVLAVKESKEGDITRVAKKLGSIWILSGKIYQTMIPTSFFPKPCDLVNSGSVINQILVISPYTGFLTKNQFYNSKSASWKAFPSKSIFNTNATRKPISFSELKKRYENCQNLFISSDFKNIQISTLPVALPGTARVPKSTKFDRYPRDYSKDKGENLSLNYPVLSFPIKNISYYQMGYFLSFWSNKKLSFDLVKSFTKKTFDYDFLSFVPSTNQDLPETGSQLECGLLTTGFTYCSTGHSKHQNRELRKKLFKDTGSNLIQNAQKPSIKSRMPLAGLPNPVSTDLFFLSSSLKQELDNSVNLPKLLYLQSFPSNYKTKTGGLVFYDSLYLENDCGQIFWVPQESYKVNPKTLFVPNDTGFVLFPTFEMTPNNLSYFVKKFAKKWVNKNFPLLSKYNSQGQIRNFSSKMSGWLEIKSTKKLTGYCSIQPNGEILNSFPKSWFWEVTCLKNFLSKQFINFKNRSLFLTLVFILSQGKNEVINSGFLTSLIFNKARGKQAKLSNLTTVGLLSIKNNCFRPNPYILVKQRHGETYKSVSYKKNYLNNINEARQISQFTINSIKLNWFLKFEKYTCNKVFLKYDKITRLTSRTPFINSQQSFITKNSVTSHFQVSDCTQLFNYSASKIKPYSISLKKGEGFQIDSQTRPPSSVLPVNLVQENKKSSCDNCLEIGIKSGWVYFPRNQTDILDYHKQLFKPGFSFIDNVEFDQHITYLECISIPFLSVDTYTYQFSAFQVKEKNVYLGLQLNFKELFKEFPLSFLKLNTTQVPFSSYDSSNVENFIMNLDIKKSKVLFKMGSFNKIQNCNNLNLFLFKLDKFIFFKKKSVDLAFALAQGNEQNSKTAEFHPFTRKELNFIKSELPDFVKFGSNLTLCSDKIYYIKNKNHRYFEFLQNKNINVNKSFLPKKLKNISSFYLVKSYQSVKKKVSLANFKNRLTPKEQGCQAKLEYPILKIFPFNLNSFGFQSVLPEQFCNIAFSTKVDTLNNNFSTPSFFILIRKVKEYSVFKSKHYKKVLLNNNQGKPNNLIIQSQNDIGRLTNLTWFNKQVITKLFSSFPSADFQFNSSFRFKNSKHMFFTKELNIVEFFILLNIPKKFPFKTAKVGFVSKHTLLSTNSRFKHKVRGSQEKFTNFAITKVASLRIAASNKSSELGKQLNGTTNSSSNYRRNLGSVRAQQGNLSYITNYLEFSLSRQIDNASFLIPELKNKTIQFTNTKLVLHPQNSIAAHNPLSLTDFFSPYQGEITDIKTDFLGKQSFFLLTEKDQISFSTEQKTPLTFVGKLIRYGEQIANNLSIANSGQIIQVDKSKVILRKAQPILFSSKGVFYVHHGDFVEKNSPLLTLFYQRLKTGDIVQGIPKIEQLFEARQTKEGEILPENLHDKLHNFFEKYKQKYSPRDAARKSLEKTQQLLVDGVQRVYQSQGVTIADKHLEIIVRQMTSKVRIVEGGQSGLLRGELIDLDRIEIVNNGINSQKAEYEPVILGITKAALETESFISAASFQETTRILARAAIERKTDFLRGLKENVILGHLIPAGTGFSRSFDPKNSAYSKKSEKEKLFKNFFLKVQKNEN
uniref:DNA-directed RNA polymerase subunit beta'' n=1 Tax=Pseudochlorella signiensis TaxID=173497 RepID=A0A097KL27_9CHLO|nr:beta''subunit of RNA polymerase [Pseudochlorella signiensis]AIT93873.1 beta''subunit of RNA polymerase [Pseudochlorella signiensis]